MDAEQMEALNLHWAVVTQQATQAAAKASAPYVAPEDHGIHLTKEDTWEKELKEAGWVPISEHPHSAIWRSPHDGLLHGGLFVCWSLMNEQRNKKV